MVPGRVLEVACGQIRLGMQFLFVVDLGGLVGGRAAAGGNSGRDNFARR